MTEITPPPSSEANQVPASSEADPAQDPAWTAEKHEPDEATQPPDPERPNPTSPPTAPLAPAGPQRRIFRSRHDRKIGGVSAGIAEYCVMDPTIVRLAMVFLALTGVGIPLYIAAWLIMPERAEALIEPQPVSLGQDRP